MNWLFRLGKKTSRFKRIPGNLTDISPEKRASGDGEREKERERERRRRRRRGLIRNEKEEVFYSTVSMNQTLCSALLYLKAAHRNEAHFKMGPDKMHLELITSFF